jgi:hypothetical protein
MNMKTIIEKIIQIFPILRIPRLLNNRNKDNSVCRCSRYLTKEDISNLRKEI